MFMIVEGVTSIVIVIDIIITTMFIIIITRPWPAFGRRA